MIKGMRTCNVCGRDFPLLTEEHYVAEDPQKIGAIMNLVNTDIAHAYDAIDCPHCGCQNVLQPRKPAIPTAVVLHDTTEDEESEE